MAIAQFSVPQIENPLGGSSKKGSHVYFLLQVFWVILLFDINVVLMQPWWHQIVQSDVTIVVPWQLSTGSIHDYLFATAPWWVLYEVLRITFFWDIQLNESIILVWFTVHDSQFMIHIVWLILYDSHFTIHIALLEVIYIYTYPHFPPERCEHNCIVKHRNYFDFPSHFLYSFEGSQGSCF